LAKAQSELLGLAMVVLLIALGFVFLLSFMVATSDSDTRKEFVDKELAINTLNAMLDTNTLCRGNSVKKLIVDCATNKRVRCGNTNQLNSCQYLFSQTDDGSSDPQGVVPYILNQTLDNRNDFVFTGYISYIGGDTEELSELSAFGGASSKKGYFSNINTVNRPQCPRGQVPGIFPLPISTGTIFIELYICE
jgi:hypothetical protein